MLRLNLRYTKQRLNNDYGAAVIANACKWAGMEFSFRKHHKFLLSSLQINKYGGVYPDTVLSFIKTHNMPFVITKILLEPTVTTLSKHLSQSKAIIMFFRYRNQSHVFLIIQDLGGQYLGVNYKIKKHTVLTLFNRSKIKDWNDTFVIVISKKET